MFAVAFGGCFGVGGVVAKILRVVTANEDLSVAMGVGVWLLGVVLVFVYGSLWTTAPEEIANPPEPKTGRQRRLAARAERKLQAAEARMAVVFAIIGGVVALNAKASDLVIVLVMACCAVGGGLVGYDVKRRVRRIRERFASRNAPDDRDSASFS